MMSLKSVATRRRASDCSRVMPSPTVKASTSAVITLRGSGMAMVKKGSVVVFWLMRSKAMPGWMSRGKSHWHTPKEKKPERRVAP